MTEKTPTEKMSKLCKILVFLVLIMTATVFSFIWQGERFIAQDWMILYQICNDWKDFSDQDIMILYWDKETDFKKFLLNK